MGTFQELQRWDLRKSKACSSAWACRTEHSTPDGCSLMVCSPAATTIHTAAPFPLLATSPGSQHVPLPSLGTELSRREISHFWSALQSAALSFCLVVFPFCGLGIIWQLQALLRTTDTSLLAELTGTPALLPHGEIAEIKMHLQGT